MGAPHKQKNKYSTPHRMLDRNRIQEEAGLKAEFGLASNREIWKVKSELRKYRATAKGLFIKKGEAAELEKKELITRLQKVGLLKEGATLDDVLTLTIKDLLGRRLQTVVYRKGFAITAKQARQFITHGHVMIQGQVVGVPSYTVERGSEEFVVLNPAHALSSTDHPIRQVKAKPVAAEPKFDERGAGRRPGKWRSFKGQGSGPGQRARGGR